MGIVNWLFKLARASADVKAVSSGDPERITRRARTSSSAEDWAAPDSGAGSGGSVNGDTGWH